MCIAMRLPGGDGRADRGEHPSDPERGGDGVRRLEHIVPRTLRGARRGLHVVSLRHSRPRASSGFVQVIGVYTTFVQYVNDEASR